MNYTTIRKCRVCGHNKFKEVISLGEHKIVEFRTKPVSVPLELIQCEKCTLVQLRHTTKPDLLWNEGYGYRSGVNEAMVRHLHAIAHEAEEYVEDGDAVLDIGCNDGTLLKGYTKNVMSIGIDPSKNVAKYAEQTLDGLPHRIIYDFFKALPYEFKVITAISMFYDLNDPNQFIEDIKLCLAPEGVFIVQQNYLGSMIENCAFDNICHEHLEYYSLTSMSMLLLRHGLMVFKVEQNDLNGGSIKTFICRIGERPIDDSVRELMIKEKTIDIDGFTAKVKFAIETIHNMVEELSKTHQIYAYGASTRGGTLIQACGVAEFIKYAVERNPDKWGKTMGSVNIPIISEEQARREKPDYMLVLPWFFCQGVNSHFAQREKEYLLNGGILLVPLPTIKFITKNDIISE